jgi:hypothetical protein
MQRPNPTELANYRGSYTTASKEIVDIEIARSTYSTKPKLELK